MRDDRLPDRYETWAVFTRCGRQDHRPGCSVVYRYGKRSELPEWAELRRTDAPRDMDPDLMLVSYEHTKLLETIETVGVAQQLRERERMDKLEARMRSYEKRSWTRFFRTY